MTDPMTPERLAEIRERAEKATPGPWRAIRALPGNDPDCGIAAPDCQGPLAETYAEFRRKGDVAAEQAWVNARFIANARQDVPDLLAEVERLTAERDAANQKAEVAERLRREVLSLYRHEQSGLPTVADITRMALQFSGGVPLDECPRSMRDEDEKEEASD